MPLLGKYRFSFDTWKRLEVEEDFLEESEEIEDPYVELKDWRPLQGKECNHINVAFVDGVRRTEHLIYIEDEEGNFSEGVFVSVGAGGILMKHGRLNSMNHSIKGMSIKRFLVLKKGFNIGESLLRFELEGTAIEFSVDFAEGELSPFVNELMSRMESMVAENLYRSHKPELMITDGTVHYSAKLKSLPFVGYVKKHRRRYVPSEETWIFRELKLGERTPLIRLHSQPTMEGGGATTFDKFTWYVRISEDEGISGIARLEVSAGIGLNRAKELADMSTYIVPKFASTEFTDRRAPHNLLPIKHLENALRKALGSQTLIRRVITKELLTNPQAP